MCEHQFLHDRYAKKNKKLAYRHCCPHVETLQLALQTTSIGPLLIADSGSIAEKTLRQLWRRVFEQTFQLVMNDQVCEAADRRGKMRVQRRVQAEVEVAWNVRRAFHEPIAGRLQVNRESVKNCSCSASWNVWQTVIHLFQPRLFPVLSFPLPPTFLWSFISKSFRARSFLSANLWKASWLARNLLRKNVCILIPLPTNESTGTSLLFESWLLVENYIRFKKKTQIPHFEI